MRTAYWTAIIAIIAALAYVAGYGDARHTAAASRHDAAIRATRDTIRVLDTVVVRDTVRLRQVRAHTAERINRAVVTTPMPGTKHNDALQFVPVVPLDTVTAVLKDERAACDSSLKHLTDLIAHHRKLDSLSQTVRVERVGTMRLRDRVGVSVGYGATLGNDGLVRVGPMVGLTVKVWP